MVQLNGFYLKVVPKDGSDHDKLKRGDDNYVALGNGAEYEVVLGNDRDTPCMAELSVEGKEVGTWLIRPHSSIFIDRPADVARRFTFFRETSWQARKGGIVVGEDVNGLVSATFYPKKNYRFTGRTSMMTARSPAMMAAPGITSTQLASGYSSGGTVLGEESYQRFGTTNRFRDNEIDWSQVTTITLRLVVREQRSYIPVGAATRRTSSPRRIDEY
jgi:hypothetical protein